MEVHKKWSVLTPKTCELKIVLQKLFRFILCTKSVNSSVLRRGGGGGARGWSGSWSCGWDLCVGGRWSSVRSPRRESIRYNLGRRKTAAGIQKTNTKILDTLWKPWTGSLWRQSGPNGSVLCSQIKCMSCDTDIIWLHVTQKDGRLTQNGDGRCELSVPEERLAVHFCKRVVWVGVTWRPLDPRPLANGAVPSHNAVQNATVILGEEPRHRNSPAQRILWLCFFTHLTCLDVQHVRCVKKHNHV